jgi:hypothetical protein
MYICIFCNIAAKSLTADCPSGWTQGLADNGVAYYVNNKTGQSQWEHPMDETFRKLFRYDVPMQIYT